MNESQFMDKQIMGLSNSLTNNCFINLTNNNSQEDDHDHLTGASYKKEEIFPNSVFQPVRPIGPSSLSSKIDSVNLGAPRDWNSADNKTNPSGIRTHSSFDPFEPGRVILEKDQSAVDPTLVSEIDRTIKKYADNLMHALDSVSAQLTQLESRACHLNKSVDELKFSVGTIQSSFDGRMRQLKNIFGEVQNVVQFIRNKLKIMDAQQHLAKLQVFKNLPPQTQLPNPLSLIQVPSVPQWEPYFAPPPPVLDQNPENLDQQCQLPQAQQLQASSLPQPQQQYRPFPQPQYSQPPAPAQPHNSLPATIPSQLRPPLAHHPEESPYALSQSYPPTTRQTSCPPSAASPHQQFYEAPSNMYEPPSSQPGPGFSGLFRPASGYGEQYPYSGSSSQYSSSSPVKPQQLSSPAIGHGGGRSYPQLPTA